MNANLFRLTLALAMCVALGIALQHTSSAKTNRDVEAVSTSELVSVQRGSLPIIISAPHGGSVRVEGSKDRENGITVKDLRTAEIAWLTAQRITDKLGGKPYVVIAQFSRKDADANRNSDEGYENRHAREQYDAYHRALREFVDEVRKVHGGGLLIDIHGQASQPGKWIRGTADGEAVSALVKEHGIEALTGKDSVFGRLQARGYEVLPALDAIEPEQEQHYDGGFITRNYGSHNKDGIDAIQVEIGADFRKKSNMYQTGEDLGNAIVAFAEAYLD